MEILNKGFIKFFLELNEIIEYNFTHDEIEKLIKIILDNIK